MTPPAAGYEAVAEPAATAAALGASAATAATEAAGGIAAGGVAAGGIAAALLGCGCTGWVSVAFAVAVAATGAADRLEREGVSEAVRSAAASVG